MTISEEHTQKLYGIIGRLFDVDPTTIDDSTSQDSLGAWDSLGMVNLVSELELEFNVEFDLLEIADFKNVGLIKTIMRDKGLNFA